VISSPNDYLSEISAVPSERYQGISTTDLLVYVVSRMQEHDVKLTFEQIVVAAYQFFPEAFSLVGFKQYPDASRVGRTLLQCRPKYRGLIRGSASSQFVITELGRERAAEVGQRIASGNSAAKPLRRGAPRAILDRIEQEIRDSSAFASWRDGETISEYDFYHFLHLLPGASNQSVYENFQAMADVIKGSKQSDVHEFLAHLRAQYPKELQK